jgi:hypothetical protein
VAVELLLAQVVGAEQVADPVRAGVGRPAAGMRFAVGVLVLVVAFGCLKPPEV